MLNISNIDTSDKDNFRFIFKEGYPYNTIQSLMNQKCSNWKAIIIFDGIKNNITIDDKRFSIYEIEKIGKAGDVRNYGINQVEDSEWIGFVDDDDVLSDDYIDKVKLEKKLNDMDVCLFRMIDENNKILPTKYDNGIYKSQAGISFCLKYKISKNISFKESFCEDYYYLKELEFRKNKIIISSYTCYFVKCSIKEVEKCDRIRINYD